MQIGVVFPQSEIGNDPGAIRDYAQAVEGLGYTHVAAFDHVIGANPASRPGWKPLYTHENAFHEVFVLFGFLAGCTERLGLVTSILILPQRQAALVAKQAAEVDVLSGGRMRLGVANGWNPVEYEALGEDFRTRGRRIEEQIAFMRALWTDELAEFEGERHAIHDAGINPPPVQRPIPVWLGGMADAVVGRVGRIADGWFPRFPGLGKRGPTEIMPTRPEEPAAIVARMREHAAAAGRDPAAIGIEGRVRLCGRTEEEWFAELEDWRALGATHMQVYTMEHGLKGADAHVGPLRRFAGAMKARGMGLS
jgi:probable F420-dependent oxidoreductase